MSAPPMSKLEYLKKYMSSNKKEEVKLKKKKLKPLLKAKGYVKVLAVVHTTTCLILQCKAGFDVYFTFVLHENFVFKRNLFLFSVE